MRTVHIPWAILVAIPAVVVTAGCETIGGTIPGSDKVTLPQSSATNAAIDKLGEAVCRFAIATQKSKVTEVPGATEPVKKVWDRLVAAAEQSPQIGDAAKKIDWRYTVIDDQTIENAFACPGGRVLVYTGLFRVVKDDAGLAATLGHEMTHVLYRHTTPPLNASTLASAGAIGAGIAGATTVDDLSPEAKGVVAAMGLGALVGISQAFSKEQEKEADRGGLLLTAQAGYQPSEYSDLLKRFTIPKCAANNKFLSAHPDPEERLREINGANELQKQATEFFDKSAKVANPRAELPGDHCV